MYPMMVPSGYICILATLALTQADLRNYNSLLHHDHNINQIPPKSVVQPSGSNVGKLRSETRNEMNEDLNLVGDDRIPLDYDINPTLVKKPVNSFEENIKKMSHGLLQSGLTNIALAVFKDAILNQANSHYDSTDCLGAITNIIEEEQLVAKIKNLTVNVMKIIHNATHLILQCQEKQPFSTCLTTAAIIVGPDFVAATDELEHVLLTALVVAEKLLSQVELCIGRNEAPLADIAYFFLHLLHHHDNSQVKNDEEVREEPRMNNDRIVAKKNPVFSKENWSNNMDIV